MNAENSLTRRSFLKAGAALGGGLVIAFVVPGARRSVFAQTGEGPVAALAPNAFLRVAADDSVTVLLAHSEMGQGIWTTLPMLIAEELDADWTRIRVEHAPAAQPYASPVFGMQGTGGSTTTWSEFDRYRMAGATARALLVRAAAARFGVPVSECRTENGAVIAGDRRARYGELAEAAAALPVPAAGTVTLKDAKDWKVIGQSPKRLDSLDKITGRAIFGMDVQFEGLLTALVARTPVFGGTVVSFNDSVTRSIPGVRHVVQVPSGVAVVADHFWAARLGRDALEIQWDLGPNAGLDSDALRTEFRRLAGTEGLSAAKAGDASATLAAAGRKVEAEYLLPYLAHAPMEPLNCTVRIEADRCEIWTGTQFQTLEQMSAARITGLRPDQVTVNTTFLGGGFGRRATAESDFVSEAVHVAKAAGVPVKTVWTREDDIRGGYYRSAFLHKAGIALGDDGLPTAWNHVLVGQSLAAGTPMEAMMVHDGIDHTSVEGVSDSPYLKAIADRRVELHSPQTGIKVLWWRSVGHSHTGFVMESLVDELAHAAGQDPVEYRRRLLKDEPRHLGVLNLAAEKAGWGADLPAGRALGVAVHASFGSYCAQVAEVSVENGAPRVHRVVVAIDCGMAVNPDNVVAQMESCVAFGLSAALHGRVTFRDGRVQQSNYHDYRVLRMAEMPRVEVHILNSGEKMGGIGEAGVPPVAPAVANAVFALTGQRLRELPMQLAAG